ncbi:MAG: type II toxin-antitoxin system Phd/YefM family antitoxin [Thermodesulfobacteriota bacterium]|nr:type II toxin-antitoxin system Phd/YefM family antitoxin [Thermodesulfobacteriota bacterium]
MKFLSVRDLKSKSALVWKELPEQKDMVITSNGRPVAILSSVTEDNLEQVLSSFRQARAMQAVNTVQQASVQKGTDTISMDEIDDEIKSVRSRRKK